MKHSKLLLSGVLGTLGTLSIATLAPTPAPAASPAPAALPTAGAMFEVTVTNLTRGQIISPVLVATHSRRTSFYELGEPASPELGILAEDGDNAPLRAVLDASSEVYETASGAAGIPPGGSETILISSVPNRPLVSLAGMMITTNDAFVSLDGAPLPLIGKRTYFVPGLDAGTEANSESCMYVPGPPCGSGGVHDPSPAEGYVHVSNGIQGIGDIPKDVYDWRNPAARIEVRRVY